MYVDTWVTEWAEALDAIAAASGNSLAKIASEAGISRSLMSHVLAGRRSITVDRARAVNRALALMVHEPAITPYLDAFLEVDNDELSDEAVEGFLWFIATDASAYLRKDARSEIDAAVRALGWPRARRLIIAVNQRYRKRLLSHILGSETGSAFDELVEVCKKHGIDLTRWLRPKEERFEAELQDRLQLDVRKALQPTVGVLDVGERFQIEQAILRAFERYERELMHYIIRQRKGAK